MNIIGIIPARGGSKGIPGKNSKILLGKPLIAYTIEQALQSNLAAVVVSSDDPEILEISRQYGAQVLERPSELAQDNTPTLPVLVHVLDTLNESYDAVMTLQPTSPLRTMEHINEAIVLFENDPSADALVSVEKVPHNMTPNGLSSLKEGYLVPYEDGKPILRRQEKPTFYARNGAAIYITRENKVREFIFGGKLLPYFMSKTDSIDIDGDEDWKLVELILNDRKSK